MGAWFLSFVALCLDIPRDPPVFGSLSQCSGVVCYSCSGVGQDGLCNCHRFYFVISNSPGGQCCFTRLEVLLWESFPRHKRAVCKEAHFEWEPDLRQQEIECLKYMLICKSTSTYIFNKGINVTNKSFI